MTVMIPFSPNGREPFKFTVSVGGNTLFVTIPFNLYSNRYYVSIRDGGGETVVYCPLVGSPDNYDINLALPYAPGSLIYRVSKNQFEAV